MDYICQKCGYSEFYYLKNGYLKCKKCSAKRSPKKIEFDKKVYLEYFMKNNSALQCAKELNYSYGVILKRFDEYRENIKNSLEDYYMLNQDSFVVYEEFILTRENQANDLGAINIIIFSNQKRIFSSLLPTLKKFEQATPMQINDFIKWHKIKSPQSDPLIVEFYQFLQQNLKLYRGISYDKLYLYIKEMEYKFMFNDNIS